MARTTRWSSLLKACAFAALLTLSAAPAAAGLVAQWSLEEGSGTTLADSSGDGHNATLVNPDGDEWVTTDLPPVPSGTVAALDLDGSNDYAVATGYKGVTGTTARSASAWVNSTNLAGGAILSWGNNALGQKWTFRTQNNNGLAGAIRVEVNGGFQVGDTLVADGQWHHVAATWEGNNVNDVKLWVDGVLQGLSATQATAINTAPVRDVWIGNDFSGREFDGQLDEVQIYDHALSRAEIGQLAGVATDSYWQAVQADSPIAYWRLGEASGGKAFNEGSVGSAIDGGYASGATLGQPSLVPTTDNTSVAFDGVDDQVNIPNNDAINSGTTKTTKSFEMSFSTAAYEGGDDNRVIYEQGGTTNGFNLYVWRDGTDYYLRQGAWADTSTVRFTPQVLIDPDETYHALSTYSADADRFILYVNGAPVSAATSATVPVIPAHTGAIALGAKRGDTQFQTGTSGGDGNWFEGTIDEVALYNDYLGIRSAQTHYEAATGDRLGITPGATLGVGLNYDAGLDKDGDTQWQDTIGSRPDEATLDHFDWNLGNISRENVSSVRMPGLHKAYAFGSNAVGTNSLEDFAGDPTEFSASFEIVFKPNNLVGQEVLFETGGTTNGLSIVLDGSELWFNVKEGGVDARPRYDLTGLENDFIHVVGVADLDNDEALIYVNGVLSATLAATGDLADWAGSDDSGLGSVNAAINFGTPANFDGQIALFRFYPGMLSADDVAANFAALIPEPSSLVLLGLGLLGLALGRRRGTRGRRA